MKIIEIGPYCVLIDDEDLHWFVNRQWYVSQYKGLYYVRCKSLGSLHRVIICCPSNMVVDHVNGNGLDNRRSNLRICSQQQNTRNQTNLRKNKSSQFKGVTFDKSRNKWIAMICLGNKKYKNLGRFESEEEAASVYDEYARILDREFFTSSQGERLE